MFEEKIVEVDNKENYYVIKQTMYEGSIYLLTNMLVDDDTPSDDYYILRVDQDGDKLKMIVIKDEPILTTLKEIFAKSL